MEPRADDRDGWRAARAGAALFRRPADALIEIVGPERQPWLNSLVTNKVVDLTPGRGARAFFLVPTKGRVLADLLACETGDALWLDCRGGSHVAVLELLTKYYFGQEVEARDRSSDFAVFSLQGVEAERVLTQAGAAAPGPDPGTHVETVAGVPLRAVRWSDTGLPGFRLWVAAADADALVAALLAAGATAADDADWTLLQIEGGVAEYGRELTEETIPLEAPTENAIDHTKGCYPGQEVIARMWARGRPAKRLVGLRIEAGPLPAPGATLDAEGKPGAATVTASAASPDLGGVALAYVHRDHAEPGVRLTAGETEAVVVGLPIRAGAVVA